MKKLSTRLLLNAEPFGFGPTAAIAGFFPHLREAFETIGYLGKKHTLDLQKGLPYDAIHDVTDTPKDERSDIYGPVFAQYDILFTAMDHKIAEEAQKAGLKVFYYDALAWYWPEIPQSVRNSDLYIAQNFFGVEEKLSSIFARHASAHIVSPIAPDVINSVSKEHVLINLGGLQNPYWPLEEVVVYARSVIASLRQVIPQGEKIILAGSQAIVSQLANENIRTFARQDMAEILARSKLAFMTPGLGNIYDAAAYNVPTIWLPPANDSQGQQLKIIEHNAMSDAALDWHQIGEGAINYCDVQSDVLKQIAQAAINFSLNSVAQKAFIGLAKKHYEIVLPQQNTRTAQIISRFGRGGEEQVAKLVIEHAESFGHG